VAKRYQPSRKPEGAIPCGVRTHAAEFTDAGPFHNRGSSIRLYTNRYGVYAITEHTEHESVYPNLDHPTVLANNRTGGHRQISGPVYNAR